MSSQQQQNTTLPTFVKQFLLLVLPKQSQQIDTASKPNKTTKASSPFEKMYFSFPALEEDTVDSTCGQHHTRQQQQHEGNNLKPV
ncbi:unnamed protein product [Mucor hiemalis]